MSKNTHPEVKIAPFSLFEGTSTAKTYYFYISQPIDDPHEYVDMIHTMKTAEANELIYIYINCVGGQLRTGVQLINAMVNSAAHVVTVLEGEGCSLATLLFLAGRDRIVTPHSRMMFHNFSSGTYGKGNEQIAQLTSTIEWYNALMNEICEGFLTQEEMDQIARGVDLWLSYPKIVERLELANKVSMDRQVQAEINDARMLKEHAASLIEEANNILASHGAAVKKATAKQPTRRKKSTSQ